MLKPKRPSKFSRYLRAIAWVFVSVLGAVLVWSAGYFLKEVGLWPCGLCCGAAFVGGYIFAFIRGFIPAYVQARAEEES